MTSLNTKNELTEKLIQRMYAITNDIFVASTIEIYGLHERTPDEVEEFIVTMRHLKRFGTNVWYSFTKDIKSHTVDALLAKQPEVDELYLKNLLKLSTKNLENILKLHEINRPTRAEKTVEAIKSELTRRILMEDSAESDDKKKRGKNNGKRKTKSNKGKAPL